MTYQSGAGGVRRAMRLFDDDGMYIGAEADDEPGCPICHAGLSWEECDVCAGEGTAGHDCGEDTCCCLYPEDNVACDQCDGYGGWYMCLQKHEGKRCYSPNELPGTAQ